MRSQLANDLVEVNGNKPTKYSDPAILFAISFILLFLGMPRYVNVYDEGLVLTAAMRILAGQIPYRDFYANYGPAEFYSFAWFFKAFGQSVLVERIVGLCLVGLTVAAIDAIAARYCSRWVAFLTALFSLLWFQGIMLTGPSVLVPVALLNLITSMLVLPAFSRKVSAWRLIAAGVVAGLSALYRPDTGAALFILQSLLLLIATRLHRQKEPPLRRSFAVTYGAYLLGFAAIVIPPVLYYLSVSPIAPFIFDLVTYPRKYYWMARRMPFPGVHLNSLDQLVVYMPLLTVALSVAVLWRARSQTFSGKDKASSSETRGDDWKFLLLVFGSLSLVMYLKGVVRVGSASMYLSIVPAIVMLAVLFERRHSYPARLRVCTSVLVGLCVFLSIFACVQQILQHLPFRSVPGRILRVMFFPHRPFPGTQATWCGIDNPLTRGFCFLPDDARIATIEFIDSHTQPGQRLYVGLLHHDKIVQNENLIYFATQRLPATKWSHFDPDLQNTVGIQTEMIGELEKTKPPFIVLDSEFDKVYEPNDSSRSTGVVMLDNYIRNKYHYVESFEALSIWQRNTLPQSQ